MLTKIQKWGNSLALRIPKAFALDARLEKDSLVEISLIDGQIVIKPILAGSWSLEDLLSGVNENNIHSEIGTGDATGREILVNQAMAYIPDRGDVVWITLNPQAGHEQSGRRPALVISPGSYNRTVGLAILCPITSQVKGYPFEVLIPDGLMINGAILSDQVKSLDWQIRQVDFILKIPADTLKEVQRKLYVLLL